MVYSVFKKHRQNELLIQLTPIDTMTQATPFAIAPAGQQFPRFAFRALANGKVSCTHHHLDGKVLRKRTDCLTDSTATSLLITLRGLGYKNTEFLN